MSFNKFKSDSYCVGGRHKSGTKNIVGEITINKKTGKEVKLLMEDVRFVIEKKQ